MTYVIGTAGHVDHGKSTLVEALTGIDPDRLDEEKEREMTIDLGFAWLTLPGGEAVGIVDVPGHRDFIENMLAGVGGIDLALLVIAADESVMPQTREHLAILDLLDVPGGVVALTKIDMVADEEWLELVMLEVAELIEGTAISGAPIVPVSGKTGQGVETLLTTLDDALRGHPPRPDHGQPRLPVDRVFSVSGFGTVVTGTLIDGTLSVGDEVVIAPRGIKSRVRGLQSHKEKIENAQPGSRVAINLTGVDTEDIKRGDVVAAPGMLDSTTLIDVQFKHLESAGRPLQHNAEVKFFSGAAESLAHVRLVGDELLPPGASGWLQLRLKMPLALDQGDRYIIRYPSPPQTIGGGIILDAHPPHRWRRFKPHVIERFEMLASGAPDDLLQHVLEDHIALTPQQAAKRTGLPVETIEEAAATLLDEGTIRRLPGGWLMAYSAWSRTQQRMVEEARAYHARYPLRIGVPREAVRSKLGIEHRLYNELVLLAQEEGFVVDEGTALRLAEHSVRFSSAQEEAVAELFALIEQSPTAPPSVKDATEIVSEEVLGALVERGDLVLVSEDVLFDADTYHWMIERIVDYIREHEAITVAEARDLFDTSRKYTLGLLEHLDGAGITRRIDDKRVLGRLPD